MLAVRDGSEPDLWSYAIVYGYLDTLLSRSLPTYGSREQALEVGGKEIENVRCNLSQFGERDGRADG